MRPIVTGEDDGGLDVRSALCNCSIDDCRLRTTHLRVESWYNTQNLHGTGHTRNLDARSIRPEGLTVEPALMDYW